MKRASSMASLSSVFKAFSDRALPEITVHKWKTTGRRKGTGKINIPEQEEASIYADALTSLDVKGSNEPNEALECPPLYLCMKRFPAMMAALQAVYRFRWNLCYPLQKRVPLKGRIFEKSGVAPTFGELFLILPFLLMFIFALVTSFIDPSVTISGQLARLPLILALVSGTHNSLITMLLGIPFERILFYHRLSGRLAFINGLLHTYAAFFYPANGSHRTLDTLLYNSKIGEDPNFWYFLWNGSVNSSGTILATVLLCVICSSVPYIRRTIFELFFYLHLLFAVTMVGCAFYHSGSLVAILACVFYGTDLFTRKVVMAMALYPRKAYVRLLTPEVVEIAFPKTGGFDYNPGQYVYLAIPEISLFEWHPFSISSSPHQPMVTFHIRVRGNWTGSLKQLARHCNDAQIDILMEGPYGSVGVDLFSDRYKIIMLMSGGIGVTPMQSICHQLMYEHELGRRKVEKIWFMWTARDPEILDNMDISSSGSRSSRNLEAGEQSQTEPHGDKDSLLGVDLEEGQFEPLDVPDDIAAGNMEINMDSVVKDAHLAEKDNRSNIGDGVDHFFDAKEIESCLSKLVSVVLNDGCGPDTEPPAPTLEPKPSEGPSQNSIVVAPMETGVLGLDSEVHGPTSSTAVSFELADGAPVATVQSMLGDEGGSVSSSLSGNDDVLHLELYLTTKAKRPEAMNRYATSGRPDIKKAFKIMRDDALRRGENKIAVCVCAPTRLVSICREACIEHSDDAVRFDFHSETFG